MQNRVNARVKLAKRKGQGASNTSPNTTVTTYTAHHTDFRETVQPTLHKVTELSHVFAGIFSRQSDPGRCDCCQDSEHYSEMECTVHEYEGKMTLSWLCSFCFPLAMATDGATIQSSLPLDPDEAERTMLSAASWLDSSLLERNYGEPFVRRPLLAEIHRANKAGINLPKEFAIVVMQVNGTRARRRVFPKPFPWNGDAEWSVIGSVARAAIDVVMTGEQP